MSPISDRPDDLETRGKVSNLLFKFVIGVVAVIAAAAVPRLVAALGTPGEVKLVGFTSGYVRVSVLSAVLIGVILVIFEWNVPKTPRDSFMVALGIPAVLVGAFNTTILTRQMDGLAQMQTAAFQSGALEIGVPIEPRDAPIQPLTPHTPEASGTSLDWSIVPRAYAQQPAPVGESRRYAQTGNVGINYRLPRYYVALGRAGSQREAEESAARLREEFPEATAVRQGDTFLVVESIHPKLSSEETEPCAHSCPLTAYLDSSGKRLACFFSPGSCGRDGGEYTGEGL